MKHTSMHIVYFFSNKCNSHFHIIPKCEGVIDKQFQLISCFMPFRSKIMSTAINLKLLKNTIKSS